MDNNKYNVKYNNCGLYDSGLIFEWTLDDDITNIKMANFVTCP